MHFLQNYLTKPLLITKAQLNFYLAGKNAFSANGNLSAHLDLHDDV